MTDEQEKLVEYVSDMFALIRDGASYEIDTLAEFFGTDFVFISVHGDEFSEEKYGSPFMSICLDVGRNKLLEGPI